MTYKFHEVTDEDRNKHSRVDTNLRTLIYQLTKYTFEGNQNPPQQMNHVQNNQPVFGGFGNPPPQQNLFGAPQQNLN
jgi:hypothetical protein